MLPDTLQGARPTFAHLPTWIAYGGIGAAALMLEVGWTRLFGMVLLRTEYVLAVILAVYLIGVGAGSLLAHAVRGPRWLAILPPLAAASGLFSLAALPWLSRWAEVADYGSLTAALSWQGGVLALLTFPLTLALGAKESANPVPAKRTRVTIVTLSCSVKFNLSRFKIMALPVIPMPAGESDSPPRIVL